MCFRKEVCNGRSEMAGAEVVTVLLTRPILFFSYRGTSKIMQKVVCIVVQAVPLCEWLVTLR